MYRVVDTAAIYLPIADYPHVLALSYATTIHYYYYYYRLPLQVMCMPRVISLTLVMWPSWIWD